MRWVAVCLVVASCGFEPTETGGAEAALSFRDRVEAAESSCTLEPEEPEKVPEEVLTRPPAPVVPWPEGARTEDGIDFLAAGDGSVVVREALLDPDVDAREVTLRFGDVEITVVARGVTPPRVRHRRHTVLSLASRDLHDYVSAVEVSVREGQLFYHDIRVETAAEHRVAGHSNINGFASEPLTCGEQALAQFGSLPAGMPSFQWPINEGCSGQRCLDVRRAYVHAVHATWRMTQIMDIVAGYPSGSREWIWERDGVGPLGTSAGDRTRLKHFFGPYTDARFATIRELFQDHLNVLRTAHMDGIDLRLKCPTSSANPGNGCFSSTTWAHHVVKGWVNVCPRMWSEIDDHWPTNGWADARLSAMNQTIAHELFHHHWVQLDGLGWRMLKDRHRHHHGTWCLGSTSELLTAQPYGGDDWDADLRHLAGYVNAAGDQCGHRRVLLRNLDSYNGPAHHFGRLIREGELVDWPRPGDPTPQPPTCTDGPGCLCIDIGYQDAPDGDYHEDYFCTGELECVRTAFGAGNEVGVCTGCDPVRGIGCPCRDGVQDCDVGSCFGDDTGGTDSSYGRCFEDPPEFACLVNCDALLNHGECLTDHPDWARCVPPGTGLPEASNCWWDGGHLDPNGEGCVFTAECGPDAPGDATCADLGYPPYFTCSPQHRCVPDL